MTDQKQEARTLTLGERIVFAARLAVEEHLRQSVTEVPPDHSYFALTDYSESSYPETEHGQTVEVVVWEPASLSLRGAA